MGRNIVDLRRRQLCDGSDVVEGQAGNDTMLFNGSAANEVFNLSANSGRALFTRNVGNITMDLNDVERVELRALGGTDDFNIGDLSATDVTEVVVDLAATIGGTADGVRDQVTAAGRATARSSRHSPANRMNLWFQW